jgi:hypothetical protein
MQPRVIDLTVPHNLTRDEARRRLAAGFGKAGDFAQNVGRLEQSWAGDRLDFTVSAMGQTVSGHADVRDTDVVVQVTLPWLLAKLADTIKPQLERHAKDVLKLPGK